VKGTMWDWDGEYWTEPENGGDNFDHGVGELLFLLLYQVVRTGKESTGSRDSVGLPGKALLYMGSKQCF
jgi:hypothetical protein